MVVRLGLFVPCADVLHHQRLFLPSARMARDIGQGLEAIVAADVVDYSDSSGADAVPVCATWILEWAAGGRVVVWRGDDEWFGLYTRHVVPYGFVLGQVVDVFDGKVSSSGAWPVLYFHVTVFCWLCALPMWRGTMVFSRGMAVPLFLCIGRWLKQESVIERGHKSWVLCLALLLVVIAWMFPVNISGYVLPYGIGSVITAVAISIAVLVVLKKASEMSAVPSKLFLYAGQNSLIILCVHSLIHTWQIVGHVWDALPQIGYVYRVWCWGVCAFFECGFLVVGVYFLQKIPVVHRFFHGK